MIPTIAATTARTAILWSQSDIVFTFSQSVASVQPGPGYLTAMKSISTAAPIGSAATPTVERLGFTSTPSKNSP